MRRFQEASEIPRRYEIEPSGLEISQITSCQAAAIDACDSCNHSVRRRHGGSLTDSGAHDFSVSKRCFLRQTENPIRETTSPIPKPLLQAIPRDCFAISPWRAWATLARQLSVIALLVFALDRLPLHADGRLALELPALATLWVLLGWSFTGLFILGHDCGHYAFSKRRWVNDLLGDLIMATLFSSYKAWKLVHNQHHVWSNVRGKDVGWPEQMKTRRELAQRCGIGSAVDPVEHDPVEWVRAWTGRGVAGGATITVEATGRASLGRRDSTAQLSSIGKTGLPVSAQERAGQ